MGIRWFSWFVVRVIGIRDVAHQPLRPLCEISPIFRSSAYQWVDIRGGDRHVNTLTGDRYRASVECVRIWSNWDELLGQVRQPAWLSRQARIIRINAMGCRKSIHITSQLQRLRVRGDGTGSHGARIFRSGDLRASAQPFVAETTLSTSTKCRKKAPHHANGARNKGDTMPPSFFLWACNHALPSGSSPSKTAAHKYKGTA